MNRTTRPIVPVDVEDFDRLLGQVQALANHNTRLSKSLLKSKETELKLLDRLDIIEAIITRLS